MCTVMKDFGNFWRAFSKQSSREKLESTSWRKLSDVFEMLKPEQKDSPNTTLRKSLWVLRKNSQIFPYIYLWKVKTESEKTEKTLRNSLDSPMVWLELSLLLRNSPRFLNWWSANFIIEPVHVLYNHPQHCMVLQAPNMPFGQSLMI